MMASPACNRLKLTSSACARIVACILKAFDTPSMAHVPEPSRAADAPAASLGARARAAYDDVPYPNLPYWDTHPARLATIGRLFGMRPPRPDCCRVLELGCAEGGNLIPMA